MKTKKLPADCMACLISKNIVKHPDNATEAPKLSYVKELSKCALEAPEDICAPAMARNIYRIYDRVFNVCKDYRSEKEYFDRLVLGMESELEQMVRESADPFKEAIRLSMAANYIDFAAINVIDEDYLRRTLRGEGKYNIDEDTFAALKDELARAEKLMFATDNCGEIVVDKILVKIIKELYPNLDITVVVKGATVQGDANTEDAVLVGMDKLVRVVDTGNDVAGIWVKELSEEATQVLSEADLIITKGQANFETLGGLGFNVFFILLCKCPMIAAKFGVEPFTGTLSREPR